MYCQYCATELPKDSKFCPSCGKPVNAISDNPQQLSSGAASLEQEREQRKHAFNEDEIRHFESQTKSMLKILHIGKILYFVASIIPILLCFGVGGIFGGIIGLLMVYGLYRVIRYFFHRDDCPNCKSFGSMQDTRSDYHGVFFSLNSKDHSHHYKTVRHYQVCYKCGYSRIDERIE